MHENININILFVFFPLLHFHLNETMLDLAHIFSLLIQHFGTFHEMKLLHLAHDLIRSFNHGYFVHWFSISHAYYPHCL